MVSLVLVTEVQSGSVPQSQIKIGAEAVLERNSKKLFLNATSASFHLAEFVTKGKAKTVLVEGELLHHLEITDDLGAKGDETGKVRLTIRPIESSGEFGAVLATREVPGDEFKVDSPSGITITTYGCCQENSAETLLSLGSLKTLYVRSGGVPLTTYTRLGKPALGRLIAVYLAMTAADESVLGKDKSAVGLITVEGEDEVLQRILVHLNGDKPRETALDWSFELGWKTASVAFENHTVIDPAKPSKPVFIWKIGDQQSIELPLFDDRLDIAAAKLPTGVTLQALSP
jgi:hypothetical protein